MSFSCRSLFFSRKLAFKTICKVRFIIILKLEPGIQKIEGKKRVYYRAQIRIKGHKPLSRNFEKYQEAKEWCFKTREAMKIGHGYETTKKIGKNVKLSDLSSLKPFTKFLYDIISNVGIHLILMNSVPLVNNLNSHVTQLIVSFFNN